MNKILKLDANLFFAISIISLSIGGIWMSYTEEKNLIQLGIIVLGGLAGILGGIIGFIQRGEIIKHESGLTFEISDADPRRIKSIKITYPK